ncbi:hypothetical protein [Caldimonas tepidiphila]|uniref:hypothetical protein n=1 Tax=Caldimonas tepidiphila TaxID=2315841 RepID=UPI000E5BCAE1|nr:hypothetical protein [Caldimonas tepidiphila]
MKPSDESSRPAAPGSAEPRDASGGRVSPRSNEAGSGNTLGDGRTAGGDYNAEQRDELADDRDGPGAEGGDSGGGD